jgi:hypothetical protein
MNSSEAVYSPIMLKVLFLATSHLYARESLGSREVRASARVSLHLPPRGPRHGPGNDVMATPAPCHPRPTSGHFFVDPAPNAARQGIRRSGRFQFGKGAPTTLKGLEISNINYHSGALRFGIGSVRKMNNSPERKITSKSSTFLRYISGVTRSV